MSRNVSYYVDKHVVKMIVESIQILSTVNRLNGLDEGYSITHRNHPCVLWAGESKGNWEYLRYLTVGLLWEWRYRYHNSSVREHKSELILANLSMPNIKDIGLTEFVQCMPEYCKVQGDAIEAYRKYYVSEKQHIASWTKRERPYWFK